jgi:hypothetical protein
VGGSTFPRFCDGCSIVFCCRIPAKAIGFLLAGARAIQRAVMMLAASSAMLVGASARLEPYPAFEPSAFFPGFHFC